MLRLLAILCLLCANLYPKQAEWWDAAGAGQRASIKRSYDDNKEYDRGFMLAAFNPIESAGGELLINTKEKSGGQYAQRAYSVAKRKRKHARLDSVFYEDLWEYHYKPIDEPSEGEVDRALQQLIVDREFDDRHARAPIDGLLARFCGDWTKVAQSWKVQKKGRAAAVRHDTWRRSGHAAERLHTGVGACAWLRAVRPPAPGRAESSHEAILIMSQLSCLRPTLVGEQRPRTMFLEPASAGLLEIFEKPG